MLHIMLQGSFHFLNFCYTHKLVDLFNEFRVLVCAVHMMVLHGSCDIHDGPLLHLEVTSHNSLSFSVSALCKTYLKFSPWIYKSLDKG